MNKAEERVDPIGAVRVAGVSRRRVQAVEGMRAQGRCRVLVCGAPA